jgi:flagellar biogenesis protein FliO
MNTNFDSNESPLVATLKFVGQVVAVVLLVLLVGWGLMRIASWSAARHGGDAATAIDANQCDAPLCKRETVPRARERTT